MTESAPKPPAFELPALAREIAKDVVELNKKLTLLQVQLTQKAGLSQTLDEIHTLLARLEEERLANTLKQSKLADFETRLSTFEQALTILINNLMPRA